MTLLPGKTRHPVRLGSVWGAQDANCWTRMQPIFDRCQCRRARIVVSSMVEYSSWSGEQSAARRCDRLAAAAEEVEARSVGCRGGFPGSPLTAKFLVGRDADWSGCFGAGFDEGEPLVAEVGDYL